MPKAVLTGMLLQFTVMPVLGWAIATSFGFSPEIAAGIILIGSCSGGVASNVMAYLARGNVALSVTMTACSTVMAPLATPFLMKVLAGRLIEIDVLSMMLSIVNLILLPIGCGLAAHYFLHSNLPGKVWRPPVLLAAALFLMAAEFGLPGTTQLYSLSAACLLMACLQRAWVERGLPIVSMGGICYIIAIIAAGSRSDILASGVLLFGAALLHNVSGYAFGYWGGRLGSLPERDCRTVAFEVGMQNGGMGTALAINVLQSGAAALGPVVFGTWMNLSGSTLASYWKGRPPNRSRIGAPLEEKKASLPDS